MQSKRLVSLSFVLCYHISKVYEYMDMKIMNEGFKLLLGGGVSIISLLFSFETFGKISSTNNNHSVSQEKKSDKNNVVVFGDGKTVKGDEIDSDANNNHSVSQEKKSDENDVIVFSDGKTVKSDEIDSEMKRIPDQLSEKMSLKDIRLFITLKIAFGKSVVEKARKSKIAQQDSLKDDIERRKRAISGMMLLSKRAEKLMTHDELKKYYDKIWEENFKNTKEFSLKVMTTPDKSIIERIKKNVKDEATLNKQLETYKSKVKVMDLDSRTEAMFPPEISEMIKKNGKNSIVGPIDMNGMSVMFFVKDIAPAKKQEFTDKFEENYKKVALPEFMNKILNDLYTKNKVKFFDVDGKEIDVSKFNSRDKKQSDKQNNEKKDVAVTKLKDDFVVARIGSQKITVKDVKEHFKLSTLHDESFLMMSQQFHMGLSDLLSYAVKLVVDERIMSEEVKKENFLNDPELSEKLKEIESMMIVMSYLKDQVKITPALTKKVYNNFIDSIPPEDKNDHEISTKVLLFKTKEDADKILKSILSGSVKFNDVFKTKSESDKSAMDMGYVKRKSVDQNLWSILKKAPAGACHKEVVELDGNLYGLEGKIYMIVYVGDRRKVQLPSLQNPNEKKYFENMAFQEEVVNLIISILKKDIKTINGLSFESILKDKEVVVKKMITVILSSAL